jgi:ferric-dicitrate binding protein FerR (iron transport regulator)
MGTETRNGVVEQERERFFALLEQELVEERPLDAEELNFRDRLAAEDAECRAFSAAIADLARPDPVAASAIDRAIRERRAAPGDGRRRGVVAFAVTSAALAAAVALVLVIGLGERDGRRAGASGASSERFLAAESGERAGAGHVFTADRAPLYLRGDGDVEVGLDRAGTVEVAEMDENDVALRLTRGRVAIHLKPGGRRHVRVITPLCEVVVKGTIFSVDVEPREVRVGVVRGTVAVSNAGGDEIAVLGAGESLAVAAREEKPLDAAATRAILALLRLGAETTASAPLASGGKAGGDPSTTTQQAAAPGEAGSARSKGRDIAASHGASTPLPEATPAELIRRARERVKVQDWAEAVALYRQIERDYPSQPEAVTVRVPLAEIELDHLGSPGTALTDYRHYLAVAPNGPLAEDAFWGVCSALRQLGRKQDEATALTEFLRRFPQSLHAPSAKVRIGELEKR